MGVTYFSGHLPLAMTGSRKIKHNLHKKLNMIIRKSKDCERKDC